MQESIRNRHPLYLVIYEIFLSLTPLEHTICYPSSSFSGLFFPDPSSFLSLPYHHSWFWYTFLGLLRDDKVSTQGWSRAAQIGHTPAPLSNCAAARTSSKRRLFLRQCMPSTENGWHSAHCKERMLKRASPIPQLVLKGKCAAEKQ